MTTKTDVLRFEDTFCAAAESLAHMGDAVPLPAYRVVAEALSAIHTMRTEVDRRVLETHALRALATVAVAPEHENDMRLILVALMPFRPATQRFQLWLVILQLTQVLRDLRAEQPYERVKIASTEMALTCTLAVAVAR